MRLQFRLTGIDPLVSICILLLLLTMTGTLTAQNPQVEDGFNPFVTRESNYISNAGDARGYVMIQPDGKMVLSAYYRQTDNTRQDYLYRVNADGSLDTTFNCSICAEIGYTEPFWSPPDGKILLITSIQVAGGGQRVRLVWLNQDGSVSRSVTTPINAGSANSYRNRIIAVQPDGKVFVEHVVVQIGIASITLYRLNTDGTLDNSFQTIGIYTGTSSGLGSGVRDFELLPDGKFYLAGAFSNHPGMGRYNPDGTPDTSFENPLISCNGGTCGGGSFSNPVLQNFAIQSNGKIVIVGRFHLVNGISRMGLARLHTAGNVDLDAVPSNLFSTARVEVLPNDKMIVSDGGNLRQLFADGTFDDSGFGAPQFFYQNWKLDSLGRVVFFAGIGQNVFRFGRLNTNGTLDTYFNLPGVEASVSALARQPDGKILAAGEFDKINGTARNKIARLNAADASIDASFDPGAGFNTAPSCITVQADGKILVGGNFTTYNGVTRLNIARLNANGTLDNSFNPVINGAVYAIAVQADGKIVVGGAFTAINNQPRQLIARLHSDGSIDTAFNLSMGGSEILSIIIEPDGKIVIGGSFSSVGGFVRPNLARLNPDGSTDSSLSAGGIGTVRKVVRQPDGKYIVSNGNRVSRLNPNGIADSAFQTTIFNTNARINDIALYPDGSIIVGGAFSTLNNIASNNIARLLPNGTLDSLYLPEGANGEVRAVVAQPDGKTVVGGNFSVIGNKSRTGLARINNVSVIIRPPHFDFNGDGKADLAVFRPSNGFWYIARPTGTPSQNFDATQFGVNGDLIVPADYDGDGRADVAVWRPSDGVWYLMQSSAGFRAAQFGANGDIPVPADYDGDGKANLAVFRPSTGSWYIARPTGVPSQNFDSVPFGISTDKPVVGADFDGDGRADVTVYRPSDGTWYRLNSSNGQFVAVQFGIAEDKPVAADYDGDGKADISVFRPSNGTWYRINSSNNAFHGVQFGAAEDRPAPADYNGDGKTDFVVFRPSEGIWYLLYSNNVFSGFQFGTNGDLPAANAFVR